MINYKIANSGDISINNLNTKAWNFNINPTATIFDKIKKNRRTLGEISKIFVGIQTSADPVYILSLRSSCSKYYNVFSKELNQEFQIEKEIVLPLLKGAEIRRYEIADIKNTVLFPYRTVNDKIELITKEEFELKYPKAWEYLTINKKRLLERSNVDKKNWWHFPYPKNLIEMSKVKILTQVLAKKASFTFDKMADYAFVGGGNAGGYGLILQEDFDFSSLYLLGLLNSKLLDSFLKSISTTFRGGYFSYAKRFIEQIPIEIPELKESDQINKYNTIVQNVELLLKLKLALNSKENVQAAIQLKKQIIEIETEIDYIIYDLYNLTDKEINLIENQ